jgi:hypothetical protein
MSLSYRASCAAFFLAILVAAPCLADTPRLRLEIQRCVHIKQDHLSTLVQVELKGHVSVRSAQNVARVSVEVGCARGGGVTIQILDEDGIPVASRTLDIGAYGAASRPRLLALAIAEMVGAIWETPPAPPVPEPKPAPAIPSAAPGPTATATTPEAGPPAGQQKVEGPAAPSPSSGLDVELPPPPPKKQADEIHFDIGARVGTRKFGGGPFEFGGALRGALSFRRRLVAELDLALETGVNGTSLGDVLGTTSSLGAWAGVMVEIEQFELRGGIGLRAGVAHLQGKPSGTAHGASVTGGWMGPMLALAGCAHFGEMRVEVGLDGGVNLMPVRALVENAPEVSISGAWFTLQLGVGYRL